MLLESLAGAVEKAAVAHVIDKKALSSPEIEKIKEDETLRLEGYCDVLQKPGITAEPRLLAGNPAEELINEARASACSMIIAASSDREGQEDAPFGSVARKLCEISEFPVLLVPFPPPSPNGGFGLEFDQEVKQAFKNLKMRRPIVFIPSLKKDR